MILAILILIVLPFILSIILIDCIIWNKRYFYSEPAISIWVFVWVLLVYFPLFGPIISTIYIISESEYLPMRLMKTKFFKKLNYKIKL